MALYPPEEPIGPTPFTTWQSMPSQNRLSLIYPAGEVASEQEILGSTDVHLYHQQETTQSEPYNGLEGGVMSGLHPIPARHEDPPLQSRQVPLIPVQRGDPGPRFGVADSPQLPSSSWIANLPLALASGQLPPSSGRYMTATPSQMTANSSSIRSHNSRSPLPSEAPPRDRTYGQDPQSYPGSTPQPFRTQSYSQPHTLQTNPNPSAKPFFSKAHARMPASRNSSGFVAVDPFRIPKKRTNSDDTGVRVPPSYDDIRPAQQLNNCTYPHQPYPSGQQTSAQQRQRQQKQGSSAPLNSHQEAACPVGVNLRPYSPPSPRHAPQHEGSSLCSPDLSQASEPLNPYPPDATPDHQLDLQPQSGPPMPVRTESFSPHYHSPNPNSHHNGSISPSPLFRREHIRKYLLWPSRHNGKPHGKPATSPDTEEPGPGERTVDSVFKTIPRQVYLHILLRLPSLYFSRVSRIFEEADLSLEELKAMALETGAEGRSVFFAAQLALEIAAVPPAYKRLKVTWEGFIDSVMREWQTFNIVSALLLSAILTILQIQSAEDDYVTRYAALTSLICALISLLFGCLYIIRFGSMRKTYKAAEWALEAQRSTTVIWWNVWVLLAMPAIWLTWSLVLYIVCIMSFVWRTRPQQDSIPPEPSDEELLAMRAIITIILGIGLVYGYLIVGTFRRYGDTMDVAWKARIDGWLHEKAALDEAWLTSDYPNLPHASDNGTVYRASDYPPRTGSCDTSNWSRPSQPSTDSDHGKQGAILVVPPTPAEPSAPEPSMTIVLDSTTSNSLGLTPGDPVASSHLGHGHFLSPVVLARDSKGLSTSNTTGQSEETQPSLPDNKPLASDKKGSMPDS